MRNKVINYLMDKLKNKKKYSNDKLIAMQYGLEGLYLTLTKVFIITLLSLLLGLFKEYLLFTILYIPLRLFSFGWHAKDSKTCWITSIIFFLFFPYLGSILNVNKVFKIIIFIAVLLIFIIYAPADTNKRPIINKYRRLKYKLLSILIVCTYMIIIFKFNNLVTNEMLIVIIYQSILINPIIYKIFGQSYANYKKCCLN